jgi:hypothetical protein
LLAAGRDEKEPERSFTIVAHMKTRKPFHPATGIVRRFLHPLAQGYAQRKKLRQSAWYNSAARHIIRIARPTLPQSRA